MVKCTTMKIGNGMAILLPLVNYLNFAAKTPFYDQKDHAG